MLVVLASVVTFAQAVGEFPHFGVPGFVKKEPPRRRWQECNGDLRYCELPLSLYTFPGTHASNSWTAPKTFGFSEPLAYCLVGTQLFNISQQLDFGVRYLDFEACTTGTSVASCRVLETVDEETKTRATTVFVGQRPLEDEVAEVLGFLDENPGQVVVLKVQLTFVDDDLVLKQPQPSQAEKASVWLEALNATMGTCASDASEEADRDQSGTGCIYFPKDSSRISLGQLVESNRRLLVIRPDAEPLVSGAQATRTEDTASFTPLTEQALEKETAKHLNSAGSEGSSLLRLVELQLYRSNTPHHARMREDGLICNIGFATSLAAFFMPGDDALDERAAKYEDSEVGEIPDGWRFQAFPAKDCGGTCGCWGYLTQPEAWQQEAKAHGFNFVAVVVDFAGQFGEFFPLIARMNEANLRTFEGVLEPERPLHLCPFFVPTIATTVAVVAIVACCLCVYLCRRKSCLRRMEPCMRCLGRWSHVQDHDAVSRGASLEEEERQRKEDARMGQKRISDGFVPVAEGDKPVGVVGQQQETGLLQGLKVAACRLSGRKRSGSSGKGRCLAPASSASGASVASSSGSGSGAAASSRSKASKTKPGSSKSDFWPAAPSMPPWYCDYSDCLDPGAKEGLPGSDASKRPGLSVFDDSQSVATAPAVCGGGGATLRTSLPPLEGESTRRSCTADPIPGRSSLPPRLSEIQLDSGHSRKNRIPIDRE